MGNGDDKIGPNAAQCRLFALPEQIGQRGRELFRAGPFRRQAHLTKSRLVDPQSDHRLEVKPVAAATNAAPPRVEKGTRRGRRTANSDSLPPERQRLGTGGTSGASRS